MSRVEKPRRTVGAAKYLSLLKGMLGSASVSRPSTFRMCGFGIMGKKKTGSEEPVFLMITLP